MLDKDFLRQEIKKAQNEAALNGIERQYLGKNGKIVLALKGLKNLPKEKRAKIGREANDLKMFIEAEIQNRKNELQDRGIAESSIGKKIDITVPGKKMPRGHFHPLTKVLRGVEDIFDSMGFEILDGPEVESEWYNFDALNIPADHPARDLWDTFWLKNPKSEIRNPKQIQSPSSAKILLRQNLGGQESKIQNLLLRTHTSPMQIRYMEKHQPPFRIIVPGRCFRHEATDASHDFQFNQIEGLMVGKDVSLANLKGMLEGFMKRFFGASVKFRWQPSFFPFVEPGLEFHIKRESDNKWLEMGGCGMVHPNVFKAVKYVPRNSQGFAFGMGLDRIAMIKYKIDDIRLFYLGDLRFLNQF